MKAVLVICEGRSDIAFARRSLIAIAECKAINKKISEFPAPFGTIRSTDPPSTVSKGLIATRIETCLDEDPVAARKFPGAATLPTPQFDTAILNKEESIIYLFVNAGGRDQYSGNINLLEKVDDSMRIDGRAVNLEVMEYATAFLFDANSHGKENVILDFCRRYCDHFGCISYLDHAGWVRSDKCPVGVFICCGDDGKGTVENYIIQMTESTWAERHRGASDFIAQNKRNIDKVSGSEANRLKAIIATVGQFNFPGNSLFSLIDDESKGIPGEKFRKSKPCKDLVKFLQDVPWGD